MYHTYTHTTHTHTHHTHITNHKYHTHISHTPLHITHIHTHHTCHIYTPHIHTTTHHTRHTPTHTYHTLYPYTHCTPFMTARGPSPPPSPCSQPPVQAHPLPGHPSPPRSRRRPGALLCDPRCTAGRLPPVLWPRDPVLHAWLPTPAGPFEIIQ